ncbi:MAG: cupin domain-containing protein [Pseudomonadota bacterium]
MALPHASPWQAIDVSPLGAAIADTPTHALLKTHVLELMRVVLRAGETLPPHSVYGELTLHCLEGEVVVEGDGVECPLKTQEMVLLPAQAQHALRALRDSSLLLTVQLPPGRPGSESSTL